MNGILFKPDMIQAIIEGRKAQTRRLGGLKQINLEPDKYKLLTTNRFGEFIFGYALADNLHEIKIVKPRYQQGETVYIKEAYIYTPNRKVIYKLDNYPKITDWWNPMWMAEMFARYFITITDVRAERLQEITQHAAKAEGCGGLITFSQLWNSINKDYPWESNCWVWVYTFRRGK